MRFSLLLICLLLGGVIYYQLMYYPHAPDRTESSAPSVSVPEANDKTPVTAKSLRAYAEIVERPLFSPDRRPPAVEAAPVDDSIDIGELENLVLFGVVISGETKYAIVGNRADETSEQLKEGHRYKGWRVDAIFSDSIQFVSKEAQYELFISPDDTQKKSSLRSTARKSKTPKRQSVFGSTRKKGQSPIRITTQRPATTARTQAEDEIDEELRQHLEEEDGYEFDLDAQFDEDELEH